MEKEGITENELRRTLPHASEETIRKNIGNTNWLRRSVVGSKLMGDAYENLQRADLLGGNRAGKTQFVKQVIDDLVDKGLAVTEVTKLPNGQVTHVMINRVGEWCEIGGKRKYLRSHWEKNYAHYLEFLKVNGYIRDWNYETKTFWFEGIRRGVNNYKPDFYVILNDEQEEFREVKGFMDPKSKTKLKRMKKYFPLVKMRVIDGAWFKIHGKKMAQIVPGWTKKKVASKSVNP